MTMLDNILRRPHLLAAATLFASAAISQQVVNIDLGNGAGTYAGQGALADPGNSFWNGFTGSASNLIASDGVTATGISATVTSSGDFAYGNANVLLGDYQFVTGFGLHVGNIAITGLQANSNYLIYAYSAGDQPNQAGVITLNGVVGCTAGSTSSLFLEGENYTVLDVPSDASGAITGTFEALNRAGALNGLQIVQGTLPPQVLSIKGNESPQVHSAGDAIPVTLSFNDTVTLSQSGAAQLTLDFDGSLVTATHAGATSGETLTFVAVAPSLTTRDAKVVANSLQLLAGATLVDSAASPVALSHDEVPLPNDQVSTVGLSVYPPVPGLAASPHYSFRVREVGGTWQSPFAWFTKCTDNPDPEFGYYAAQIGGWSHSYCNFEMANNVPIEVEITRLDPATGTPVSITSAVPHPRRKVRSWKVEAGKAYVTLEQPALFAVDIDEQHDSYVTGSGALLNEDALHGVSVFANPIILDKPDLNDPSVLAVDPGTIPPDDGSWTTLYFKPGVHQIYAGTWAFGDEFRLRGNRSYYIPGDAMVHGNLTNENDPNNVSNIRIFGHGTLSGERIDHPTELGILTFEDQEQSSPIRVNAGAKGCRVEGVTMADPAFHACTLKSEFNGRPEDFNYIRWSKVIGWRANSDGITPNGSSYLEDCFLRTQDDGTYITGLGIRRCVYWHDVNGMPLRCSQLIKFNDAARKEPCYVEDIDVIYARTFFGAGSGRSIIGYPDPDSIYPGANGDSVVFRNINVEDLYPTRTLFGWGLNEGTGATGAPQPISGVRFENVRAAARNIDGELDVFFGDSDAPISGLIFRNVTLAGEQYDSITDFDTNAFVSGFVFEDTAPEARSYQNTSGYGKWYLRGDWAEGSEPANNDIVTHTATDDVLTVDSPAYAGTLTIAHPNTATVAIQSGGELTVTGTLHVGSAGTGTGSVQLFDGMLRLDSSQTSALAVAPSGSNVHMERGEIRWSGDRTSDVQALYAAGQITFGNGRDAAGPTTSVTLIAQNGSSCLYADYDATSDETTVFVVTPVMYGVGCGSPALVLTPDAGGKPVLGQTATATISNAPTTAGGAIVGWSNQNVGPAPLPATLSGIGMPGCFLWTSSEVIGLPVTPLTASTMQYSLAVPNVASLVDAKVYVQAFAVAPGVNAAGLIVSNGIEWKISDV
ncbi:MAG: hypothetical protein AB8H80_22480 [Planctomycetota bacterium]